VPSMVSLLLAPPSLRVPTTTAAAVAAATTHHLTAKQQQLKSRPSFRYYADETSDGALDGVLVVGGPSLRVPTTRVADADPDPDPVLDPGF
jgi:hypothetical protein